MIISRQTRRNELISNSFMISCFPLHLLVQSLLAHAQLPSHSRPPSPPSPSVSHSRLPLPFPVFDDSRSVPFTTVLDSMLVLRCYVSSTSPQPLLSLTVSTVVSFKDKTAYRNVSVSGDIFVRNQLKVLVKVGSVDFQQDDSQGNPVLVYLQGHGKPQDLTAPIAKEGYSSNTLVPRCQRHLQRSSDQRTVLKNLRRFQPDPCQPLLL